MVPTQRRDEVSQSRSSPHWKIDKSWGARASGLGDVVVDERRLEGERAEGD